MDKKIIQTKRKKKKIINFKTKKEIKLILKNKFYTLIEKSTKKTYFVIKSDVDKGQQKFELKQILK